MIRILMIEPKRLLREIWGAVFTGCPQIERTKAVSGWEDVMKNLEGYDGIFSRCEILHRVLTVDGLLEILAETDARILGLGCDMDCVRQFPFPIEPVSEEDALTDLLDKLGLSTCERFSTVQKGFLQLTDKEHRVVQQLINGTTYKEIADQLGISPSTVQSYKERAMVKLGVESLTDLTVLAASAGLRPCPCKNNNYQI